MWILWTNLLKLVDKASDNKLINKAELDMNLKRKN